ncbi:MAG: PhnD/SsuA/transferrin family substrate-binding protein, partial [Smithellaceae bacterium]|nr:PhnD/SsuA/transferrin family substrate-binding protein [Smithellaceae bacterium]
MTGYRNKYMRLIVIVIMLTLFLFPSIAAARQIARIGVLANLGKETARKMWTPTADYLTASIPTHSFMILPLGFEEISGAVKRGDADFVLTNPGVYVELEHAHGVARIATVDTLWEEKEYNRYGGVIFTRADRKDIDALRDLKGKTFMALHETSLGGWRTAWRELKAAGVDPARHFSGLMFSGESQERVVFSVWNKEADAGTVRTGILERL